jgi:hypothetical protein
MLDEAEPLWNQSDCSSLGTSRFRATALDSAGKSRYQSRCGSQKCGLADA